MPSGRPWSSGSRSANTLASSGSHGASSSGRPRSGPPPSGASNFGSHLLDEYHFSFDSLVLANSLTTLIAVPLVFLLPRLLVLRKDAEIHEETPGLETAME